MKFIITKKKKTKKPLNSTYINGRIYKEHASVKEAWYN